MPEMGVTIQICSVSSRIFENIWKIFGIGAAKKNWAFLIRAVADRLPPPSPIATDLIRRGLLTTDRKPFSDLFKQIITESIPRGKSLLEAVEDLEKGAERANKLFEQMVKLAEAAGKIYAAFKGNQESDS